MDQLEARIRRYLLGDLEEDDRAELDLRLLSDEKFGVSIELAEEDLIEEYLNGSLSPDESERFVQHFSSPPERQRQFELSRKLFEFARDTQPSHVTQPASDKANIIQSFFGRRLALAFSLAALFIVIGFGIFYVVSRDDNTNYGDEGLAALNRQDLSNLTTFSDTTRITLLPGTVRDPSAIPSISLNAATELILIRLALPEDLTGETVSAKFFLQNAAPLELTDARIYSSAAGSDLRILIPRDRFATGTCRIEVVSKMKPDLKTEFTFEVTP